jgi:hypothetical protein
MARALYAAPIHTELVAQVASLLARVSELEAELAALRTATVGDIDAEFRSVARDEVAALAPAGR